MASIALHHISERFPLHGTDARTFRRALAKTALGGHLDSNSTGKLAVMALSGLSLWIKDGERVGLIGLNGAGKSTLLKVMAGIYQPTQGVAYIEGRVVPLMDTYMGIVSDATGRENIRNRGYLLGMTPKEIETKVEDIIGFSELGPFIDLPVRTYSAGMYMRLAFAISTAAECDILLVDEGIGAGDALFVEKAAQRIDDMFARAGILVIASHAEAILRRVCTRVLVLDHGTIHFDGPTDEALESYHKLVTEAAVSNRPRQPAPTGSNRPTNS